MTPAIRRRDSYTELMQVVSVERAVAGVRSGEQIFVHGGAATPTALLVALVARASELRDVGMIHFHTEGPAPHLAPDMARHFRHRALFIGANARDAVNEGRADYVPIFLSDVPELFTSGVLPLDVALDQRLASRRPRLLLPRHER